MIENNKEVTTEDSTLYYSPELPEEWTAEAFEKLEWKKVGE